MGTQLMYFSDQFQGTILSIEEVGRECAVHPDWIRRMIALGLLDFEDEARELMPAGAVSRIDRIQRLRRDLGVNYNAIGLILELLDKIEVLEAKLASQNQSS
jgi:hypothetical protein